MVPVTVREIGSVSIGGSAASPNCNHKFITEEVDILLLFSVISVVFIPRLRLVRWLEVEGEVKISKLYEKGEEVFIGSRGQSWRQPSGNRPTFLGGHVDHDHGSVSWSPNPCTSLTHLSDGVDPHFWGWE
ncbi:hypothetical protein DM860_004520 [Cuscuta australis]|uniref:Uncharacterized protein n=1 Tax=Cuscuta australis TaxID=267555 RepID=A0A328EBV0_9ASTE|nr:hypothetical protein DM860_004520 [Cuscuta australis]